MLVVCILGGGMLPCLHLLKWQIGFQFCLPRAATWKKKKSQIIKCPLLLIIPLSLALNRAEAPRIRFLFLKTLFRAQDSKEIKQVNPKGNQPWILIGKTDDEAEAPILWPPDSNSQLIEKDPDGGKDWGQEEKGMTEDEMVACHHRLNGHEFE